MFWHGVAALFICGAVLFGVVAMTSRPAQGAVQMGGAVVFALLARMAQVSAHRAADR